MSRTPKPRVPAVPELRVGDEANLAQVYRTKAFPFVRQGTVYGFELKEDLARPAIGPGESAILALTAMVSGLAYGISGGDRGHLFYFHPAFGVTHVGVLGKGRVSGAAVVDAGGSEIIGGWWGPDDGGLFRHSTAVEAGQGLEQFQGSVTPITSLPPPVKDEGVATLVWAAGTGTVYGLTHPGRSLFAIEATTGKTRVVARIEGAAPVMVVLPNGHLLGGFVEGRLWEFAPAEGTLRALGVCAPCQVGKRHVAGVQSLIVAADGSVYGGSSTDGFLFRYEPVSGKLVNLGKPNRQSNIRALAEGHDGLIYGIAEEPQGMAHLFIFDPTDRGFTDLGIVGTAFPYWFAHSIGCLSVGPFGEVLLGETDRISHVFVYYPPIPKRQR